MLKKKDGLNDSMISARMSKVLVLKYFTLFVFKKKQNNESIPFVFRTKKDFQECVLIMANLVLSLVLYTHSNVLVVVLVFKHYRLYYIAFGLFLIHAV